MGKRKKKIVSEQSTRYYHSQTLSLPDLAHWIAFSRIMGIGPVRFKCLLDFFQDDVVAAWQAERNALAEAGLDTRTIERFLVQRKAIVPMQELELLERLRIQVITWKDEGYPPLLRKIEYAPAVLYLYGNLSDDDRRYALGIVGTRRMTAYGRQVTEHFATGLARGQVTIVSGLAAGVDTIAHVSALDSGGRTIAVLASGLDHIYPATNKPLARRIVESGQGALLTAFPLGVRPETGNFPARNHIIAGLSLGVLVTEAPQRSGSLITASSALAQGREVFSVPGGIFSPTSSGANKLIQDGAHAVTQVNDILTNLNLYMIPQQTEVQTFLPANEEERIMLDILQNETMHIDEVIRQSGLAAHIVSANLTTMALKGMVRDMGNMQYKKGT